MEWKALATLVPLALVSACAQSLPPMLPPTLTYDRADCSATPDLTRAISLTPVKGSDEWEERSDIWSIDSPIAGNCLRRGNVMGPYLVYALPEYGSTQLIETGSVLEGVRLFSPMMVMLDGDGAETRLIEPGSYMFRTNMYSAQIAPTQDEKYMLVSVNPDLIGERYEAIRSGINTTTIYTGYGASNWNSGVETALSQGYSYEGTMRTRLFPVKDKK